MFHCISRYAVRQLGAAPIMDSPKSGLEIIIKGTGEIISIDCLDEHQLVNAILGTAKNIDKAKLNIGRSKAEPFYMGYQNSTLSVILDSEFRGTEALVFLLIENTLKWGNRVRYNQKEIADLLGIDKSSVSRAFKKLKDRGVIYRDKRITSRAVFLMNTKYAIKGKAQLDGAETIAEKERVNHTAARLGWKVVSGGKS